MLCKTQNFAHLFNEVSYCHHVLLPNEAFRIAETLAGDPRFSTDCLIRQLPLTGPLGVRDVVYQDKASFANRGYQN